MTPAEDREPNGRSKRPRFGADPCARGALEGARVLIVEDDVDSREVLELLLASEGAVVETAGSADEALASVDAFAPDVLLSDIGMPTHDGYWLVEQIRKTNTQLPAIALTAYSRQEDAMRARSAGFDVHVSKPVDSHRLVDTIARFANLPAS